MKNIIVFLQCFCVTIIMKAQTPSAEWVKDIGGSINYANGNSIASDALGNTYITGPFQRTMDFDPGPANFNLVSQGYSDIFILKLNPAGNFIWAKQLGGTLADISNSITLDESGNIYITGSFEGTGDFNPGSGIFNLISAGDDDIFISKLDSSGNFIWAKSLGGQSTDEAYSIKVDLHDNVYTAGIFQDTADFNPDVGSFKLIAANTQAMFISKLDSYGNFVWAKGIGSQAFGSIELDHSSNLYITGSFNGNIDLDLGPGIFPISSGGNRNSFILKLDSLGNFAWGKQLTGSNISSSIAADIFGYIYIAGSLQAVGDFDPGAGIFSLSPNTNNDIFILKLDSSGNFVWAKDIAVAMYTSQSICVDASSNLYITGGFEQVIDFDPGPGVFILPSNNEINTFISKLDSSGNFIWAKRFLGSNNSSSSIAIDGLNNIYTTGYFQREVYFESGINFHAIGFLDVFINKINQSLITNVKPIEPEDNEINIFPNPASYQLNIHSGYNISNIVIYNTLGEQVMSVVNNNDVSSVIDISSLNKGIYTAVIITEKGNAVKKIVKQ